LGRELAEAPGLNFTLAGLRRHRPQALNGVSYCLTAVRRQAPELRIGCPELLLLLRREVLPGFHAPQNLLLALRRHAVEALQPLLKSLLPLGRKPAKIPVVFERPPLLIEGLITVLVQPLAGMMTLGGRFIGPGRTRRFPMRRGTRFGSLLMVRMGRVVLMVLGE
jgi:hypothetical protein